jgi:rifampicin phosphotransferase
VLAIPSPDVLLNLFASAAQMLGLLALALGGGVFVRRRNGIGGHARPAARWPFFVTLGLLVAVSSAFLLYHLRVVDQQHQRLRTNLVRKSMEGQKAVGDTSLKTLSFSGQSQHPRGVSTEQLQQWLDAGRKINVVDVREPEEVEMGQLPGSWARRYPDLQQDDSGLCVEGVETILMCESGNRSSELCDWFFDKGKVTSFVIGGYEKWVAEYRPMTGQRADGAEIRATPDYPQKLLLLDTPEVVKLFTEQGAQFVDVRYPEDFAREHLPGAINMPLRKMREAEVEAALLDLPARPIIAVCYDKRSSFYAQLLGLRLHRLGADFRGRYTVPQEFTLPVAESEWVARWKNDREGDTLFGRARRWAGTVVAALADRCGLLWAVLLLVLGLRIGMLPFSLFAERDQWQQRRLAPRFAALREQWAGDPMVWRRESLRLLREAGVSPGRNLLGALVQIVLFGLAFAGIDAAATTRPGGLWWFDLSAADPFGVLPITFGVVMAMFVRLQQQNKKRWVLPMAFVIGMVAIVWPCRAAVQLYLTASIGLMALQTVLQRRYLAGRAPVAQDLPAPRRLVPLQEAGAHGELGNKATRLGQLMQAGMPVPPGFVVPWGLQPTAAELAVACRSASVERAAVRSSALGEDSAESSMAGMFLSELDVPAAELSTSIEHVRTSYGGRPGGVVVQAFRRAQYAGVLFTVDPVHAGRTLVELVSGGGEALVSGRATPKSFRFGRASGERIGEAVPPMPLEELLALGRAAERLFGHPQDVEWVYVDGRFQLVQSRDITRLPEHQRNDAAIVEAERFRLLTLLGDAPAGEPVLEQTEISELLPVPTTYSLALFESLWGVGGAVDRACRATGFAYDVNVDDAPLVVTAFGRCFVDRRQWSKRSGRGLGAAASFRMAAAGQSLEDDWRAALPAQQRETVRLAAVDPQRLSDQELLQWCEELRGRFVTETYARAETINLAAEFFVGAARRRAERAGLDPAALLRDQDGNVVSKAFALLAEERPAAERVDAFLAAFGHRAPHDFELAAPRYGEDVARVFAMLPRDTRRANGSAPHSQSAELPRVLRVAVERARRFQALKEEAKHEAMRELAALRRLLVHVGERFGLGSAVFDLVPAEVLRLGEVGFRVEALRLAEERIRRRQRLLEVEVPSLLSAAIVELLGDAEMPAAAVAEGEIAGTCVAGSREVIGRVRVMRSVDQLADLHPGEILVVRCTDPCWLGVFPVAGGLVTEIGGWLSHAAIQAREHDLATIVGVAGATQALKTGELVRLRRDGGIERLEERRRPRRPVDLEVDMIAADSRSSIRIRDLGRGGAGIEVADASALPTSRFQVHLGGELVEASVAWRNCTRAGIRFESEIPPTLKSGA